MEMEAVFLDLLEISAASAVVILAVMLLSSLINRSFTAKWKYWLWMVLAIRLLVPFNPSFDAAPARVEVTIPDAAIGLPAAVPAQPVQPVSPLPAPVQPAAPAAASAPAITLLQLLMLVWLCGAVLFVLWQTVSYLRFRAQVKRWGLPVREDSPAAVVLRQAEAEFGIIGRQIPALICQDISSPMMIGFFRPLLLLPQERYNPQDLSYILRHELTHYSRRDIWYKALLLLANAVHWFNPAVWLMVREASRDLEISCDAAVMKNADMLERRAYSEIILSCVHRELKVRTALSTHFYGGKKALKERFANILSTKKRRAGVIAFAVVVLCGGVMGGLVACSADKGDTPEAWAQNALAELLTVTVDKAEEFYAIALPTPSAREDPGIVSTSEGFDEFFADLWGDTMTEDCVQRLVADRVFTRVADYVLERGREVRLAGLDLSERAGGENLYDYTARMASDGETVGEAFGTIQMVKQEDGNWKASRITVTITFDEDEPADLPEPEPEPEPLPRPTPLSVRLSQMNGGGVLLWEWETPEEAETELLADLLSVEGLAAYRYSFWPDGATPVLFQIDYGDEVVTGGCIPDAIGAYRYARGENWTMISTNGAFYAYPYEKCVGLLEFMESKGIYLQWSDGGFQAVDFGTGILDINGRSLGAYLEFTMLIPNSWTVSGDILYDEEGLLIAETLPWIYAPDDSAFDQLAQRYPDADPADAWFGTQEGKRYIQSTTETDGPFAGAINNELLYYIRQGDYLVGLKFYPKRGIGIGTQSEEFQSGIRIVPYAYDDPWENPDTSQMYTDEENAAWQRENDLYREVYDGFPQGLPRDSYSYYTTYGEGTGNDMQLVLEIGVIDEAAVDRFLASWTGMRWDRLVKTQGTVSQAEQEAFCEKVEQLDLGPNVHIYSRPEAGMYGGEMEKILVSISLDLYASQEEVARWQEMPQAIKDFAAENGIPENMLGYMAPRYTPPGSNPDT